MDYRFLQIEDAESAHIITLQHSDRRNALCTELLLELETALKATIRKPVILAAAGPVFSSGHDLAELNRASQSECSAIFELCSRVMFGMQNLSVPVLAEVQGLATAAGLQLVAAADLAIAAEDATFATPGVRIGLFCTTPMVPLVRAIGRKRAFQMLMTGDPIDAHTALAWGLVNQVAPLSELRTFSLSLAARIARASADTIAIGKRAFYETLSLSDETAYQRATAVMIDNASRADAKEGISAFLQKRRPVWRA
jgi:enoyl-CoA hydratase/carnithine racemase